MLEKNLFPQRSISLILILVIVNLIGNSILGCSENNLPKYNILSGLRVLALVAEPPETDPGKTVIITPIVSDINESTELTYSSFACIDDSIAAGGTPSCLNNPTRIPLSSGSITNLNASSAFTGLAPTISLTLPTTESLLGQRTPQQKYNGVSYIVEYVLQNSRGESVHSIKRILVSDSSKTVKNKNPLLSNLTFDGLSASSNLPLNTTTKIKINYSGTPRESFQRMTRDGELLTETEELTTTWFNTDGKMKSLRTLNENQNEFTGPSTLPATRPSFIIGITRDGRGGSHYLIKCFGVCS